MKELTRSCLPEAAARELAWCYARLEHPSFAARLSDLLATPVDGAIKLFPPAWRRRLANGTESSMRRALEVAIGSMGRQGPVPASLWRHRLMVMGTGAVGGFFGPLTVLAELPLATVLMLRAIADTARAEGEDIHGDPEARLACVQVFALGGRTRDDEDAEIGYYGMRLSLGLHFENLLEYTGSSALPHIPAAIQLVRAVAARFGVVISDKVAAQLVPVAGAFSAAAVNLAFMQHYQDVARGHFVLRRLERDHGVERVRAAYEAMRLRAAKPKREFSPIEGW
ncbi:EcsC family protein [Thiohalocapsa marina]|uniref:EcsC family protein n=1 Tax=Thiohalocapsa marina TaxID=424902 RepID=A0A5M8FNF5_9GAMM|nr:EcsC family protein [Thiohalocapsa marina]KAA6185530.1 EcsC family protein [Thiohalocapsa marina]